MNGTATTTAGWLSAVRYWNVPVYGCPVCVTPLTQIDRALVALDEQTIPALLQGREALKTEGPDDVGDFDLVDSVNRALERVKERETTNLRKGLGGLATVASAARPPRFP